MDVIRTYIFSCFADEHHIRYYPSPDLSGKILIITNTVTIVKIERRRICAAMFGGEC